MSVKCINCIHHGVCFNEEICENIEKQIKEFGCCDFKDVSKFIEKKCEIGDTMWIVGTKCLSGIYDKECDERGRDCRLDEPCSDCNLDNELIIFPREVRPYLFNYIHGIDENVLFKWGETVFKTKEEALNRLKQMEA